ncbi:MAG: GNAT family N-acetyltransferase [Clostridia bacterium]|nr:GNAT family N-acetyltransferase [Clostridia bacterium]
MTEICNGSPQDGKAILDGLVRYNLSRVPPRQPETFVEVCRAVKDEEENVIAGCLANIYCWNVMYIDILWVDEGARGQGLGTKLLEDAQRIARENQCTLIHLDTFDFQAKDFYLRHGFHLFGVLEGCPEGHCRYYLSKKL